ncbi:MAG: hypothetical protein NTU62_01670 [Spirochaetes bacterium]|nr:hypothetical protein [Spirochaetota bacterium]
MVGTVSSAPQPAASPITARIREHAAVSRPQAAEQPARAAAQARSTPQARTTPQKTPDTRAENGVPAWKRRIVDSLAEQLDRRGASRGSRVREQLTADNIDERIMSMSRQLRARAQERTGYGRPDATHTGMVVNRAV